MFMRANTNEVIKKRVTLLFSEEEGGKSLGEMDFGVSPKCLFLCEVVRSIFLHFSPLFSSPVRCLK